jgi:hypothetical protein
MGTLRDVAAEARERLGNERKARRQAEAKVAGAEAARDRAEHAFEDLRQRSQGENEAVAASAAEARAAAEESIAEAARNLELAVPSGRRRPFPCWVGGRPFRATVNRAKE